MDVEGLQELERRLFAVENRAATFKATRKAMMAASSPLLKAVKRNTPVLQEPHPYRRRGQLKASWRRKTRKNPKARHGGVPGDVMMLTINERPKKVTTKRGTVKKIIWGIFLEAGTKHIPANPILGRAFSEHADRVPVEFARQLADNLAELERSRD